MPYKKEETMKHSPSYKAYTLHDYVEIAIVAKAVRPEERLFGIIN